MLNRDSPAGVVAYLAANTIGKTQETAKSKFMSFVLNESKALDPNGVYMKLVRDNMTYICEAVSDDMFAEDAVTTVGFVFGGHFYASHKGFSDYDKDLETELKAFNQRYEDMYSARISDYSPDNLVPITEKSMKNLKSIEERLKDFAEKEAPVKAESTFFPLDTSYDPDDDHLYMPYEDKLSSPELNKMFIEYLRHGESYLRNEIERRMEISANEINFLILANAEIDRQIEALSKDAKFIRRVNLYKKLKDMRSDTDKLLLHAVTNGTACNFSISLSDFMRDIRMSDRICSPLDDILSITYNGQILYEKNTGL